MASPREKYLLLTLCLWGVFPLAWLIQPYVDSLPPMCTFRQVTGWPCLFCGLTRAFAHAAHGEWQAAGNDHPLWWLAALTILVITFCAMFGALRGTERLMGLLSQYRYSWLFIALFLLGLSIGRIVWCALSS